MHNAGLGITGMSFGTIAIVSLIYLFAWPICQSDQTWASQFGTLHMYNKL